MYHMIDLLGAMRTCHRRKIHRAYEMIESERSHGIDALTVIRKDQEGEEQ